MKKNMQILHFEDDDLDAKIIKNILKEEGIECSITRASCKKEYFSNIHKNDYDIILADNSLPDYDGISALKYAREHKPKIPFILSREQLVKIEQLKLFDTVQEIMFLNSTSINLHLQYEE